MKEIDLQHFWNSDHLVYRPLQTIEGHDLIILDSGKWNHNSGPDFSNCLIQINGLKICGNIEIHTKTSKFLEHGHHMDDAYNSIILHVVYEHDSEIESDCPTLVLRPHYSEGQIKMTSSQLPDLVELYSRLKEDELREIALKRFERKISRVEAWHRKSKGDWQEVFYRSLCLGMGSNVNAMAFDILSTVLPYSIIRRHLEDQSSIEALVFGQAGFLGNEICKSNYQEDLSRRYQILKLKYSLYSMSTSSWKFLRLRPKNFPSIRLAQLSAILSKNPDLFSECLSSKEEADIFSLFNIALSPFWIDHYTFGKVSKPGKKLIGETLFKSIYINAVIPYKATYLKIHGNKHFAIEAVSLLEKTNPEKNVISKQIKNSGLSMCNAMHSQAALELKSQLKL